MRNLILTLLLSLLGCTQLLSSTLTNLHVGRNGVRPILKTTQFSWQIQSDQQDIRQIAYYLRAAVSVEGLKGGAEMLWDSEKVMSADCLMIPYQGRRLPYASTIYWQLEVWLSNGEVLTSPVQSFRTGDKVQNATQNFCMEQVTWDSSTFLCDVDSINQFYEASDAINVGDMAIKYIADDQARAFEFLRDNEAHQNDDGSLEYVQEAVIEEVYSLYRCYADRHALMTFYPMMQRWMLYAQRNNIGLSAENRDMMVEMAEAVGQQADAQAYRRFHTVDTVPEYEADRRLMLWMFQDLAAIRQTETSLGFHELYMRPEFPKGMNFVKASFKSPYGLVRSEWERKSDPSRIEWNVELPANTSAQIHLPEGLKLLPDATLQKCNIEQDAEGTHLRVGSGKYKLTIQYDNQRLTTPSLENT